MNNTILKFNMYQMIVYDNTGDSLDTESILERLYILPDLLNGSHEQFQSTYASRHTAYWAYDIRWFYWRLWLESEYAVL